MNPMRVVRSLRRRPRCSWIGPSEHRSKLCGAGMLDFVQGFAKRVRGTPAKSGVRCSPVSPGREKPREASSCRRTKSASGRWNSLGGQNPGTAVHRTGLMLRRRSQRWKETVGGCFRAATHGYLRWGRLRRAKPRSAVGVKQSRHGLEGSKPLRG